MLQLWVNTEKYPNQRWIREFRDQIVGFLLKILNLHVYSIFLSISRAPQLPERYVNKTSYDINSLLLRYRKTNLFAYISGFF